jgi:cytochrome c-type biogenesis protein CcmH
LSPDRVQRMVDEVSQRVEKDPKDSSAWALLAHSYEMQGRFDESTKAYARLAELVPNNAQVLADYADALAVAQGRSFKGEPEKLLKRALAIDPKNLKALLLAGTEAFDRHAYAEAIAFWERARALPGDESMTRQIDSGLAEARALSARAAASSAAAVPRVAATAPAGRDVSGRVSLAPALQSKVGPDDTVFVFARSTLGSRMPVALLRKKVRDLPLDFRLDDTMAMVPEMKLSALSGVVVGARISKRGDATPQSGDLQGITAPVAVGSRNVKVEIGEVLP